MDISFSEGEMQKNDLSFGYLAVWSAIGREIQKRDIFSTTITSCSSEQKVDLTQSFSTKLYKHPVHAE